MTADRSPSRAARPPDGRGPATVRAVAGLPCALRGAWLLVAAGTWASAMPTEAAEPIRSDGPHAFRRVFVPADAPEAWLRREHRIVDLRRLETLLAKYGDGAAAESAAGPPSASIRHATYSAAFVAGSLTGGRLAFDVERTGDRPSVVVLDPLDLPFEEPIWNGKEAYAGTLPDGRTVLLADRPAGTLSARWSLRGRPHVRHVEFDLRLAPAATSRLEIDLPPDHVPTSSVGTVTPPSADDPSGRRWTIDLGSRTECRLAIGPRTSRPRLAPTLLARTDHQFVAAPEGLRFQSDFEVEVVDAPVSRLHVRVAPGVQIDAASYGDFPLSWTESMVGPQRRIAIELPDPVSGPARTVRIVGAAPLPATGRSVLPHPEIEPPPDVPGARVVFLGGRFHLTTRPPIVSRSIQPTGLRQVSQTIDAAGGETLSFAQFEPDARLAVDWGQPEPRIAARCWEHVDLADDAGGLVGTIEWQSGAGATFAVQWEIAEEWRVTDVRAAADPTRQALVRWQDLGRREGRRRFSAEFQDALRPGSARSIQVFARRVSGTPVGSLLPVLRPVDCDVTEAVVACTVPAAARAVSRPEGAFLPLAGDALPPFVSASGPWKLPADDARRRTVVLHSTGHRSNAASGIEIVAGDVVPAALAVVRCDVLVDAVEERLELHVDVGSAPATRIPVIVPFGDGATWEWSAESTDAAVGVAAVRLPVEARDARAPTDATERWELRLSEPRAGRFAVAAARRRVPGPQMPVSPPRPVDAQQFAAIVETSATEAAGRVPAVVGALPLSRDSLSPELRRLLPDSGPGVRRWIVAGTDRDVELRIGDDRGAAARDADWATLHVRSWMAAAGGGFDAHEAVFGLRTGRRPTFDFALREGADIVSVDVDGTPSVPRSTPEGLSVDLPHGTDAASVRVRWRTLSGRGIPTRAHDLSVPQTSYRVASYGHDLFVPPGMVLVGEPAGLRRLSPAERVPWTRRLFGPLGRRASEPIFSPFDLGSPRFDGGGEDAILDRGTEDDAATSAAPHGTSAELPLGWVIVRCEAPVPPASVVASTTDESMLAAGAWAALVGCLAIGAWLRAVRWSGRARLGAVCATGMLAATWLLPDLWTPIAGGALAGILVGSLLPRTVVDRLLPEHAPAPTGAGSTLTLVRPAVVLILAASSGATAACVVREARAQKPSSVAPDGTSIRDDRLPAGLLDDPTTVLVPVRPVPGGTRNASEPVGTAYVRAPLLERLEAAETQDGRRLLPLLTRAAYELVIDDDRTARLEAVFRVVVPEPASAPVVVSWPLAEANPVGGEACRIDGRAVPLRRGSAPGLLSFELPSRAPVPQDADSDGNAGADPPRSSGKPVVHEVRLTLRPAVTLEPGGGRIRIPIPPACDAKAFLAFAQPQRTVSVLGARGPQKVDAPVREMRIALGRADRLEVAWSTVPPAARQSVEATAVLSGQAEIRPGVVEFLYHVEIDVAKGNLDDVEWTVPPGLVLRSIQSPDLLAHSAESADASGTRVLLEFRRPSTGPLRFAAQFLWPLSGPRGSVRIPPLDMSFVPSRSAAPIRVAEHRLGVSAPSEFEATPAPLDAERAKPVSADLFVRLGTATAGGVPPRRPQFAWEFVRPVPIQVVLRIRRPLRRATVRQTGRFDEYGLHWAVRADIDTSEAPAFRHAIEVPADLHVESLAVRADGANRAARWFRKGDLVEVLLTEQTTGRQLLVLEGRLDGDPRVPRALPFVRVSDAEVLESSFVLGLERPGELRIADVGRLVRAEVPVPAAGSAPEAEVSQPLAARGPFVVPKAGDVVEASGEFAPKDLPLDVVSFVPCDASGRPFMLAVRVLRSAAPLERRRLAFRIAAASGGRPAPEIVATAATRRIERRADGSFDVAIEERPSDDDVVACTLLWRATESQPLPALPDIRFEDDAPVPQLLLVDPRIGDPPPRDVGEPLAEDAVPDGILAWMRDLVPESPPPLPFRVVEPGRWPVPPARIAAKPVGDRVPLALDRLWLDPDGTLRGWSAFRVDARREQIAFELPQGTEPLGLFVGDDPGPLDRTPDGRHVARLPAADGPRTVRVSWVRSEPASRSVVGTLDCPLPQVVDLSVAERVAVLLAPSDRWTIVRRGTQRLDRSRFVEARLGVEDGDSLPSDDDSAALGPSPLLFETAPAHDGFATESRAPTWVRLTADDGSVRFSCWLVDERPLVWFGVLAAAVVLHVFVVSRLYRADPTQRSPGRRALAWIALGFLWWLCLAPSWLGPVWIAGAVLEWWPKRDASRGGRDRSRSNRGLRSAFPNA